MLECDDFCKYVKENQEKLNEPIVVYFLEDQKNLTLFQNALNNPSQENRNRLDNAFRDHYIRVKIINYVSKLIHFYSFDYNKRVSNNKKRQILNFDTPDKEPKIHADLLTKRTESLFEEKQTDFEEVIENTKLYSSFKSLNPAQKRVIELLYINQLTNKDIAVILNMSQQLVSYHHRTALKKLKKAMTEG
ncbi:sigma-70 family RNA polymerase sigma factor [Bacillus amyloliquefaciens]|uniref:sigma-70 family RNA polymerase sigma factor n=1 Tax=Bacillus amyloliquefaciens TaxID=1390 RepID=UPI00336B4B20